MGGGSSTCTNNVQCIQNLYKEIGKEKIQKLFIIDTDNYDILNIFLKKNGLKLAPYIQPGEKYPKIIKLGYNDLDPGDKHKFKIYTVKIEDSNNNKYKNIIQRIKNSDDINTYLQNEIGNNFHIHMINNNTKDEKIMDILKTYGLDANISISELNELIKVVTFSSQLATGGGKRKVRKHKGIHQHGGNKGKLKKGYKYSGKRTKTGLPIITKS